MAAGNSNSPSRLVVKLQLGDMFGPNVLRAIGSKIGIIIKAKIGSNTDAKERELAYVGLVKILVITTANVSEANLGTETISAYCGCLVGP